MIDVFPYLISGKLYRLLKTKYVYLPIKGYDDSAFILQKNSIIMYIKSTIDPIVEAHPVKIWFLNENKISYLIAKDKIPILSYLNTFKEI